MLKNNPKTIHSWCIYDWANSAFSLVISSTIFPIYFENVALNERGGAIINFLGFSIQNTVLFSYSISFAFLFATLLSPFLSGIADFTRHRKSFLRLFAYLGSLGCFLLFFFTKQNLLLGVFAFILANFGWAGSIVFYSSFLPIISTTDKMDSVSAKGFSYGYIGSVILLLFNLSMLLKPEWYGNISSEMASRISFASVGIWWIVFAEISLMGLPEKEKNIEKMSIFTVFSKSFELLKNVFTLILEDKSMKIFLFAFLFYSMGVQTIMFVASLFGSQELKIPSSGLISTILIIQFLAVIGSIAFARLSKKFGNKIILILIVISWVLICISAYFVTLVMEFYLLAAFVGFLMGGVQSLSRSSFSKLIPLDSKVPTSYFSFYDIVEKTSLVLGTFVYGFSIYITGSMRNSIIAVGVFFLIGFILLIPIKTNKWPRS